MWRYLFPGPADEAAAVSRTVKLLVIQADAYDWPAARHAANEI